MLGLGMRVFSATFNKKYFSYIVGITFISKKNQILQRKSLIFRKALTYFITEFIEDTCCHDRESSS